MSAHWGLSFILKAHIATKDQTGLIPSQHVNKRVPKRKSKMKCNKQNKPSGHMKKRQAVPATHGCLPRSAPYLIAMSGRSVALFIPLRSSDCMLWLLEGGSAQFWVPACLLGHSPVCSLSQVNWRNCRQNCHCQSCYYQQASSVLDNDDKTNSAKRTLIQPWRTGLDSLLSVSSIWLWCILFDEKITTQVKYICIISLKLIYLVSTLLSVIIVSSV